MLVELKNITDEKHFYRQKLFRFRQTKTAVIESHHSRYCWSWKNQLIAAIMFKLSTKRILGNARLNARMSFSISFCYRRLSWINFHWWKMNGNFSVKKTSEVIHSLCRRTKFIVNFFFALMNNERLFCVTSGAWWQHQSQLSWKGLGILCLFNCALRMLMKPLLLLWQMPCNSPRLEFQRASEKKVNWV